MLTTHLLHVAAMIALRLFPPLHARRALDLLGGILPAVSPGRAMQLGEELAPFGTCLTRAMAVGCRLPGAEIILGADGVSVPGDFAHAWVEYDGFVICGMPPSRHEIARL
jgi:hypothetical protein